jgi:hypothetical protein
MRDYQVKGYQWMGCLTDDMWLGKAVRPLADFSVYLDYASIRQWRPAGDAGPFDRVVCSYGLLQTEGETPANTVF